MDVRNSAMENIKNWWSDLHYTTPQKRSLAVIAALVLISSSFFIIRSSSASETITPPPLIVENVQAPLVVDVQGAVVKPGVYRIPAGSRVVDAIKKAGGITKVGDPSDLNQARLINDGEQIYVYAKAGTSTTKSQPAKPKPRISAFVAINRASAKEFESLDGIGPILAARIVSYRKSNGPFIAIEDLLKVPGIGSATLAKFKSKVRL
jgi:competence protein ComEA